MGLVIVALGDLLGEEIGHQRALSVVSEVMRQRPGEHMAFVLAGAVADTFGFEGERALHEMTRKQAEAEFWGIVADALEQLEDENGPPEDEPPPQN
jgi:hypothetical protein